MVHPWRRDRRFDEIFCDKFNLREEYRAFTIRGEGVYPHAATKFRQKFIQLVPTASKMHGTTPLQSPRNSVCQVNKFHPRRYVSRIKVFLQKRGYRGRVKRRRIGAISFLTIFIIRTERELFQAMKTTRRIAIHLNFCFLGSVWVQISFFSFFLSWVLLGMEIYYPGILNLWIIG